ncbi:ribonuclease domain-containing protein [Streptomyces indicus]|uniref:Ribonuclease T1 n=1 Tax=Streptomyces indicus TaxID=417292 RepID=A0A1G8UYT7_9ACTN|nr:ribonuclease [Streptomyces indicus]SDJ58889.1 ribonuclease T1 [Streptomyces indicus]
MRIPPRITAALTLSAALFLGAAAPTAAAGPLADSAAGASRATAAPATAAPAAVGDICYSALPSQAHDTLDLIEAGGPYPYPQDGTVFQNREGLLPRQTSGYYHEYTVETPGSDDRGARRIVTGEEHQEDYYTADHYASFDLVDYAC